MKFIKNKLLLGSIVLVFCFVVNDYANAANLDINNISLEQLRNLKVTSVSKKEERIFDAPASIFVVTDNDIKRSGATNIAEVLRMVPGLQVAQMKSSKWAISSRGFAGEFANKLLVLIDGRSVYNPLFSGVFWDIQDTMIEDIKRIEVIKGPGGTLWGANAVNGVINIITKDAAESQDGLISARYGNKQTGSEVAARYGYKIKDNVYVRTYAKTSEMGDTDKSNSSLSNGDSWNSSRTGFKMDIHDKNKITDEITVQGDIYYQNKDSTQTPVSVALKEVFREDSATGFNILSKLKHKHENNSESTLQAYFDNNRRDSLLLEQKIDIFDVDYQNSLALNSRNDLIWGAGFRFFKTKLEDSEQFSFNPDNSADNTYSSFIQNKYALIPSKVFLTLGSKFEHNSFTGFEYQPNARISWLPNSENTLWGAVSKAVRTPNIAEQNITLARDISGFGGLKKIRGNNNIDSEELISYEIGYRTRINKDFGADFAGFYNDYSRLISLEKPMKVGSDILIPIANKGEGQVYGFEASSSFNLNNSWRIIASYEWLQMLLDVDKYGSNNDSSKSPQNQVKLRSQFDITDSIEFDNSLYYVDELDKVNVDEYIRFDSKINWKIKKGAELSFVVQNLFDSKHNEFDAPLHSYGSDISRSFYSRITLKF